ncbi:hypothetical protein C8Q74DRAFT_1222129 [Fomes fomentarius]|nr:hypothetical protein C8Q74DRAFT_1222129 [Fomes fomentarius]
MPPQPYGPRPPLPTKPQALHSTYASRLRTGTTLLMQPILAPFSVAAIATGTSRRGGVVNYADPGSGDDFPDAGAIDSDDSDFVASGGTRQAIRATRLPSRVPAGSSVFATNSGHGTPGSTTQVQSQKTMLDQSYLGQVPPSSRFITAKPIVPTKHEYYSEADLARQAEKPTALVPIRVEFETDSHRIRDCLCGISTKHLLPRVFARTFCRDLDLTLQPYSETVANQLRAQLEELEGVALMCLGADADIPEPEDENPWEENECRVILSYLFLTTIHQIDVQIATHQLLDHIEWDLLSPLTPEEFATKLCCELGLTGEADLSRNPRRDSEAQAGRYRVRCDWRETRDVTDEAAADRPRDKSGLSLLKDKTGLGLGWGRAPKDGRGPKPLRSVWRDWAEAEELRTRFEVLTAEEVERRELEKERASRRLRRETSKFQLTARLQLLATRR